MPWERGEACELSSPIAWLGEHTVDERQRQSHASWSPVVGVMMINIDEKNAENER